ncbi:TetR/AcrR family transcriptional regulator [Maritalea porphyrae]|uniref:HTH tetR-type domain-containing protein n=1 Tax=Maritalea porphyrae TaxID=880732 RepID=A0ABQ5UMG5_9HYPH|nr:TetR/AcrR family transcriptional regulator [Maritalea porphyrae]GLQ16414.1 hypothetical protein GCM10007879_06630 [Maritalea porphyrae]
MARTKNEALHVKRKSQILAAARKCFIANGIHTTSMQEICKTSKISPGALYRYYPSKQAIIEAIAAHEHQQNQELIEFLRDAKDPVVGLQQALPDTLDTLLNKDFARLMIEISTEASRNKDVHRVFSEVEDQFKRELIEIFVSAQQNKGLPKSVNVPEAIYIVLALFDGITSQTANDAAPDRKQLTSNLDKMIATLFQQ